VGFSYGTGEFTMLELADAVREVVLETQTSEQNIQCPKLMMNCLIWPDG